MRTLHRTAAALAVVVLATSACASSSDDVAGASTSPGTPTTGAPGSATPGPTAGPTTSAAPSTGDGTLPADLRTRPEVAAAIADTASRANVAPEEVLIAAWSPVTWNDGSLGCPQKGMAYTQALVDGELLILRVEQSLFQYHSGRGGPFTYCANPDASYSVAS